MTILTMLAVAAFTTGGFTDITAEVGLTVDQLPKRATRVAFADLNDDGWPDLVVDRFRVFLNQPETNSPIGRRFEPVTESGIDPPVARTVTVFVDLDDDGHLDAVHTEWLRLDDESFVDHGRRSRWQPGRGDGTFGEAIALPVAARPTIALAVGELGGSVGLDLYLGHDYQPGDTYEGYPNDLLLSDTDGASWHAALLPEQDAAFDEQYDAAGRPTFGVMIAPDFERPGQRCLLELGYGRRWNRAWVMRESTWVDRAAEWQFDGDDVRHGRYPEWLKERAKTDARFDREDEAPFRANGNTFDIAIGDIDGDGDFDAFVAEITHAWAGDSSDVSRFLMWNAEAGRFDTPEPLRLQRGHDDEQRWNHGDLFCELADLDHDGRLDLLLSSGDYPDNQRLRVFLQREPGRFSDATAELGLDHDGSQQLSLADIDHDGDLDLLVGQSFNRYTAEMKSGRTPQVRIFRNDLAPSGQSITLSLEGDGEHTARNALGAIVTATLADGRIVRRVLTGPGGHQGKQHEFLVHLGLGDRAPVTSLEVDWPRAGHDRWTDVAPGRYAVKQGTGTLQRVVEPVVVHDWAQQGYLGLALRAIASGEAVVSWVRPGPLLGTGLTSRGFDLARPDLVVTLDGAPVDAETFADQIRARAPGSTVTLGVRTARRRGSGIPESLDHVDEVRTITAVLDSRDAWSGTVGRGGTLGGALTFESAPLAAIDPAGRIRAAIDSNGLAEVYDTLRGVFQTWAERGDDFFALPAVQAVFEEPLRIGDVAVRVSEGARAVPAAPVKAMIDLVSAAIALPEPRPFSAMAAPERGTTQLEQQVVVALHESGLQRRLMLGELDGDEAFARTCLEFLRVPGQTFYLGGEGIKPSIDVIRASMNVDFAGLMPALSSLAALTGLDLAEYDERSPIELPAALTGAVTGPIFAALHVPRLGWIVIGGPDANTYDLSVVNAVLDAGGNDVYDASGMTLGSHVIIDYAGDDIYRSHDGAGAGAALLGVSYIDDRAGNDRYEGDLLAAGAAMYGASLIVDRAGNDWYSGTEWSVGAAVYGAGMIVDLGAGGDTYVGEFLCEGVGGPRGCGVIVDEAGRDLYRANGPTPSAYGTPAVFQAFSQGVGFGYRMFAAGGVGLLCDLSGDDRYEAGEFAQGGAYYFALGVLRDFGGRDLYYGNRYGQGFGVHQAHGALIDDAGDDTYWSMTAASQGAAWDIGAGLLLDRAGNDSYHCDGLGQGGASQQGVALLIDLAGVDRYIAGGGATQGASGGNNYHRVETGAGSISILYDAGGEPDYYSRQRPNDAVTVTGAADEPEGQHGLVIDE